MAIGLNLSDDQRQILEAARLMLETHYPVARLRDGAADDLAEVANFGTFGLALSESVGGVGYSITEEALLHVLLGRHIVSTRALAAAVAARVANKGGPADLAHRLVAGKADICAAIPSGQSILLLDRGNADFAVVLGNRELVLIEIAGSETEAVEALGHARPLHYLSSKIMSVVTQAESGMLVDLADLLVSAQLVGISEATRDLAVAYAGIRQQFGQPIGAFQAIKHHCANMAIAAEMASAQLDMAALALRDDRPDAAFQVAALRHLAETAALANARLCVQVHGGIGFSAEVDVHHYLKQAHLLSRLGGGAEILAIDAPMAPYTATQTVL